MRKLSIKLLHHTIPAHHRADGTGGVGWNNIQKPGEFDKG